MITIKSRINEEAGGIEFDIDYDGKFGDLMIELAAAVYEISKNASPNEEAIDPDEFKQFYEILKTGMEELENSEEENDS